MAISFRLVSLLVPMSVSSVAMSIESGSVEGSLSYNGQTIELNHAYYYNEPQGFYDESDPTWTVLFTAEPVSQRDVDDVFLEPAIRFSFTLTSEFDDEPTVHIVSQSIRVEGMSISGGPSPEMEMGERTAQGLSGRLALPEPHEFFDDSYQYTLSFNAALADPNAPIGDPLPADGGVPGASYKAWTSAIHAADIDALKAMVPAEMSGEFDGPDAKDALEFMALLTPKDIKIVKGSSDGQTAILEIEGTMENQPVSGEVTLVKEGQFWIPTESSVQ